MTMIIDTHNEFFMRKSRILLLYSLVTLNFNYVQGMELKKSKSILSIRPKYNKISQENVRAITFDAIEKNQTMVENMQANFLRPLPLSLQKKMYTLHFNPHIIKTVIDSVLQDQKVTTICATLYKLEIDIANLSSAYANKKEKTLIDLKEIRDKHKKTLACQATQIMLPALYLQALRRPVHVLSQP